MTDPGLVLYEFVVKFMMNGFFDMLCVRAFYLIPVRL